MGAHPHFAVEDMKHGHESLFNHRTRNSLHHSQSLQLINASGQAAELSQLEGN